MTRPTHFQRGFTLIEMIMVIVITGIIAGMVAVFIKSPVTSYVDMARRAELSDIADTAARRMARDLRLALPNSVRNPGNGSDQCIEFMPTKSGGRYRASQTSALTGDILDFSASDTSFDMLGVNSAPLPASSQIKANDVVVVYNTGPSTGAGSDTNPGNAYNGLNAAQIATVGLGDTTGSTKLTFVAAGATPIFAGKVFPGTSPANRFQVLSANEQAVSYACGGVSPNMTLFRYSRNISTRTTAWTQPGDCATMSASPTGTAILATHLSSCSLVYVPPGSGSITGRVGIVSISLAVTEVGETVNLYHQVHVDNTP